MCTLKARNKEGAHIGTINKGGEPKNKGLEGQEKGTYEKKERRMANQGKGNKDGAHQGTRNKEVNGNPETKGMEL